MSSCARCGSTSAASSARSCDACGRYFCRSLCFDGHAGNRRDAEGDVARAEAAVASRQTIGTAQKSRLEEREARRKELAKEAKRLAHQRKLEQRKRKRLVGRMGSLSQDCLLYTSDAADE